MECLELLFPLSMVLENRQLVTDLKKKEQKIRSFVAQIEKGPGLRKTLKLPENPVLEEALFTY